MPNAQMIAKAWMDDGYRADLLSRGIEVPPRPDDLADDQLDLLAVRDGEYDSPAPQSCCCC